MVNLTEILEESDEPPPPSDGEINHPNSIEDCIPEDTHNEKIKEETIDSSLYSAFKTDQDNGEDGNITSNYNLSLASSKAYLPIDEEEEEIEELAKETVANVNSGEGDIHDYNVAYFADRDVSTAPDGFYVITDNDDDWNKIYKNWFWLQNDRSHRQEMNFYSKTIGKRANSAN